MSDVRFIQVNHLHPDNNLHRSEFKVHRFDDLPREVLTESRRRERERIGEAPSYADSAAVPEGIARAYNLILGSMIHDIGNLQGMFGPPARVLTSEIWLDGRAVSTVLEYGRRAPCRGVVALWGSPFANSMPGSNRPSLPGMRSRPRWRVADVLCTRYAGIDRHPSVRDVGAGARCAAHACKAQCCEQVGPVDEVWPEQYRTSYFNPPKRQTSDGQTTCVVAGRRR